jgi:hypothetical protein
MTLLQTTNSGNTAETGLGDGIYFEGYEAPPPVKPGLHPHAAGAAKRLAAQQAKFAAKLAKGDVKAEQVAPTADGHAADAGAVTITGTIVSANIGGEDLEAAGAQPVAVTANNSLFGGVGSLVSVTGGGNLLGVNNPGLGALADNGGPTQTMALLPGSPAIDMGPTTVPSFPGNDTDQRQAGFPRVINGRVDIGAFEAPLVVRFTG